MKIKKTSFVHLHGYLHLHKTMVTKNKYQDMKIFPINFISSILYLDFFF